MGYVTGQIVSTPTWGIFLFMYMPQTQSSRPIFYDADSDMSVLDNHKVAVIGYGAQGRAQARMLAESGVDVVVGVRQNGASWSQIQADGLPVMPIAQAAAAADIIHILIPDENQKSVYESQIAPHVSPGKIISFSHGFNIVFKRITVPEGVGVIMIAPKAPGTEEYKQFKAGFGVPGLISVHAGGQQARAVAMAMAKAMGLTRAGVMECTFEEETYEDLFGEQAVLCGGMTELIKYGFETLTEAGYPPEFAYFECLHEAKLIVDLLYEGGMTRMWEVVSNTAEFGGHTRGPRVIGPEVKERMKQILQEVEDGTFANEWMKEADENNMKNLLAARQTQAQHPIEITGAKIRAMFKKQS